MKLVYKERSQTAAWDFILRTVLKQSAERACREPGALGMYEHT